MGIKVRQLAYLFLDSRVDWSTTEAVNVTNSIYYNVYFYLNLTEY